MLFLVLNIIINAFNLRFAIRKNTKTILPYKFISCPFIFINIFETSFFCNYTGKAEKIISDRQRKLRRAQNKRIKENYNLTKAKNNKQRAA